MTAGPLPRLRRSVPTLLFAGGVTMVFRLLAWAAPPARLVAGVRSPQATADSLGIDAAVAAVAGVACWAALGWLLVACAVLLGAAAPGRCGRLARGLSDRIVPAAMRRLLGAALGVALVTSAGVGPALAGDRSPARPTGGAVLDLDWPVPRTAHPAHPGRPAGPRAGPARHSPGLAGVAASGVTVRPGDSLWSISREHLPAGAGNAAVAAAWPRWYAANRTVIGADPNRLLPGQQLRPPTLPGDSS
ncbi:MAG: LysM peptidoglycan-binding domain-containing protein [Actinomycetota bacterium]|nr:LysM peptidoglycan-binding domain-containing protein [Actinomycetota bacterium]